MKENEKKYRLLAENATDVIFLLDMNLNYSYVSPSVKALRGYEPAEVLKQNPMEILTPSSRDLAMKNFPAQTAGKTGIRRAPHIPDASAGNESKRWDHRLDGGGILFCQRRRPAAGGHSWRDP